MLSSPARNHRLDSDLPAQGLNEKPVTGSAALFYSLPHSMIAVFACLLTYPPYFTFISLSVFCPHLFRMTARNTCCHLPTPQSQVTGQGERGSGESPEKAASREEKPRYLSWFMAARLSPARLAVAFAMNLGLLQPEVNIRSLLQASHFSFAVT